MSVPNNDRNRHAGSPRSGAGLLPLAALAALVTLATAARAQESKPATIAPSFGYEYGVPLSVQRLPGFINDYPGFDGEGTSYNHTLWFGADLLFPEMLAEDFDLGARLTLALSNGRFTSDTFTGTILVEETPRTLTNSFEVYGNLSIVQAEVRALWAPAGTWRLGFGPWISYRISSGFFLKEHPVAPAGVTIPDEYLNSTIAGEELGSYPLRFGPVLSGSFELGLGRRFALRPELYLRADLEALSKDLGLRALAIGGGLALLIGDGDDRMPEPPAAVATQVIAPTAPPPQASIDLYCQDPITGERASSCAITPRNNLRRQFAPLLPVIRFDRDSAAIPARYTKLTSEEAASFTARELTRLEPLELHYRTLDVIALRMRRDGEAKITLTSHAASREPAALATERAERIRGYLNNVWGIEGSRIAIAPVRGDAGAEPWVRIDAEPASLLAPVLTSWMVQDFALPPIGLDRSIDARAGVKGWTLTITRAGRELARYTSADPSVSSVLDLNFSGKDSDSTEAPLVAELTVEDFAGRTATARDELGLTVGRDRNDATHSETLSLLLLPSDPNFTELTHRNEQMLEALNEAIRPGARITVIDAGPASSSPWKASHVAERLLATLNRAGTRVEEVSVRSEEPDAAAGYPEARTFAGGVRVVVEQETEQ